MKRIFLASMLLLTSVSLSACIFSDDGYKEYQTPELFLSQGQGGYQCSVKSSRIDTGSTMIYDTDLEVRDYINNYLGQYETISKPKANSDRYIIYRILISHATTGPNYSEMTIYDNGSMKIDYKSSLGPHHYFYYSMNNEKASAINDYAEAFINRYQAESEN